MTPSEHARRLLACFCPNGDHKTISSDIVARVVNLLRLPADFSGPLDKHGRRDETSEQGTSLDEPELFRLARACWGRALIVPRARLHLTHDVDSLRAPQKHNWPALRRAAWRRLATLHIRKGLDLFASVRRARSEKLQGRMNAFLDAARGVPRTIYVTDAAVDSYDAEPLQGTEAADELGSQLGRDGLSLGYHPGFSVNGRDRLAEGLQTLNNAWGWRCTRLRYHYLRVTSGETWTSMDSEGIKYDSSVGWSRRLGARYGLHVPYHVCIGDSLVKVLEVPTLYMDYDSGDDHEAGLDRFLDWAQSYGAHGTVLIHYGDARKINLIRHFVESCRARQIDLVDMPDE